jgi:hypothetical protein
VAGDVPPRRVVDRHLAGPVHLPDGYGGLGNAAQRQRAHDGVEATVVEWKVLRVCLLQGDVKAELVGSLSGAGDQGRAEVEPSRKRS